MLDPDLVAKAARVLDLARKRGWHLATAESCTGGLVAALLTEVPGSSDVVDRGFVTYSNTAKTELVGVPLALLAAHGAVSEPVARAMAEGARDRASVDIAVSVTGIAGPGGATATKPVGLVHFGLADRSGRPTAHVERRYGSLSRAEIRRLSAATALDMLLDRLA